MRKTNATTIRAALAVIVGFAVTGLAGSVRAAPPPSDTDALEGRAKIDPATAGTTELEGQGAFATPGATEEESTDATEWDLAFGSLVSTGNARQISVTGATNLRLRRGDHQFGAAAAGNYGQAALPGEDLEPTVGNVQGRVRYDYFLHERVSVFGMLTARHDPFQGLLLRMNVDPGFAFYILPGKDERLWTEAGYDFQYDLRDPDATLQRDDDGQLVYDAQGNPIQIVERQKITHAVRLFGGYVNQLSEIVTFSTGLEYLQSVQEARRWRLNWDTAFAAQLKGRLSLALTFTVRVDNDPLPRVRKVDTVTALSLLYRVF
jgi:putative salt-induced outer membrane protein